ncbi:MAG: spore cortex biosynthesis protein YabQ [Clostridia bacterium]|nr:spore cortex biosynthesis protein YabQ [Clostridia bacterium]
MNQIALSAASAILLGLLLGAVYDVIRLTRVIFGVNVASPFGKRNAKAYLGYAFVAVSDFLFFAILSVLMAIFFFLTGDGRMRSYGLIGAFLGFLLYYHTVGRLFIFVVERVAAFIKKCIAFPLVLITKLARKIKVLILSLPIVTRAVKRYNDNVNKMKKNAAIRQRKKRMKKGVYCRNGGTNGEQ